MSSLDEFARRKLDALEQSHLRRRLVPTGRSEGLWLERNGRKLLSFSCNDYLGLSHHPELKAAAVAAVWTHGVGAGASRLVTGDHPLYAELEARLARMKGTQAACVFGSGYLANAGIAPVLAGRGDLILIDELSHASLWTGARLSRAEVVAFRHNDMAHVRQLLAQHRGRHARVLIVTEGVFSMDGDRAPLAELAALANEADAWLMADDAHDLDFGNAARAGVPLRIGTLSKAIGAYGGYICASQPVIDLVRNRARTLIYTTGLPPPVVAASIAALDLIEREPERLAMPLQKARAFTGAAGLPQAQSSIVPLVIGEAPAALEASQLLEAEGFLAVAIRPPTVPEGTARLRFSFSAAHPDDAIARLAELVRTRVLGNR
ncbi:MAG TPA: aminotransferase class I/II-fold pyridoxal phosphate-dependent enzyme [Xanthobacteraceae bacterium]